MKDGSVESWFVLCTKARNELKVTERLGKVGVKVYAPTKIEVRQWSDRKKEVTTPLLPSMVLVQILEKEVDRVFEIPGVVRFLFEHGKRASVSNEEVMAMRSYLEAKKIVDEKKGLVVGDVLKVPLLEQQATLLFIKGKKCLAQLQKLGAIVSFQLQ
jgi:transcription antitermination factor NusG